MSSGPKLTCRLGLSFQAQDEAAALRAKRPASPTAPTGGAAKQPRPAPPPLDDDPARLRFEAELTDFYASDAGRAAIAAVEGAVAEWRNPQISHVLFPLHTLWQRVRAEGGYDAVSRSKQWKRIAETFGTFAENNIGSKARAASLSRWAPLTPRLRRLRLRTPNICWPTRTGKP